MSDHDIFIAHAGIDKELAEALWDAIRARGKAPFLDSRDMPAGTVWSDALKQVLQSTPIVAVLVTSNWGEQHYASAEVAVAVDRLRNDDDPCVIVPILIDGAETPYGLENLVPIRASADDVDAIADALTADDPAVFYRRHERPWYRRLRPIHVAILAGVGSVLLGSLAFAAWSRDKQEALERDPLTKDRIVRIGAKHILESNVLCAVLEEAVSRVEGFKGRCLFDTGEDLAARDALLNNSIDLYVDYTGTVYARYLELESQDVLARQEKERALASGETPPSPEAKDRALEPLNALLDATPLPLSLNAPGTYLKAVALIGFTNNWELLLSRRFVEREALPARRARDGTLAIGLQDLFDRHESWRKLRVCAHGEFRRRNDGLLGLEVLARGSVDKFVEMPPHDRYCPLLEASGGEPSSTRSWPLCDLVDGYQTDPQVRILQDAERAVRVDDDLPFWPEYHTVVLSRWWFAWWYPQLTEALREVHVTRQEMDELLIDLTYDLEPGEDGHAALEAACSGGRNTTVDLAKLATVPEQQERVRRAVRAMLAR